MPTIHTRSDGRASANERGYTWRWTKARNTFLLRNPLCRIHEQRGQVVAATVVDHIIPHKGDQALFWDTSNWQSLCKRCHDSTKQAEERGTLRVGCTSSGVPNDPRHHWNRAPSAPKCGGGG